MLLSRGMALQRMIQEIGDASVTGMALRHMIQEKGDAAVTGNGVTTHDTGDRGMLLSRGMALRHMIQEIGGCCCHGEWRYGT